MVEFIAQRSRPPRVTFWGNLRYVLCKLTLNPWAYAYLWFNASHAGTMPWRSTIHYYKLDAILDYVDSTGLSILASGLPIGDDLLNNESYTAGNHTCQPALNPILLLILYLLYEQSVYTFLCPFSRVLAGLFLPALSPASPFLHLPRLPWGSWYVFRYWPACMPVKYMESNNSVAPAQSKLIRQCVEALTHTCFLKRRFELHTILHRLIPWYLVCPKIVNTKFHSMHLCTLYCRHQNPGNILFHRY